VIDSSKPVDDVAAAAVAALRAHFTDEFA